MTPEMDGLDLAAAARADAAWRAASIVVITAKDVPADDHEGLDGSAPRVLQKGVPTRETVLGEVRDAPARHGRHIERTR